MQLGGKLDRIIREFMYEKNRNNNNQFKDKKTFFNHLSEVLDEMEEYIDQVIKEHATFKKK